MGGVKGKVRGDAATVTLIPGYCSTIDFSVPVDKMTSLIRLDAINKSFN